MSPEENSTDTNKQEVNTAPEPKPETEPAVAPAEPTVVTSQSTQPEQPVAPQNVQYVVQEKSLKGVGGWLIFFMIMFGFAAVYGLIGFFGSLASLVEGATSGIVITNIIFTPLIAAASVLSIVYIAMQKKLGKLVSMATYGLTALYSTILVPLTVIAACDVAQVIYNNYSYNSQTIDCPSAGGWVGIIGGILVSWVISGLFALYFFMSKRVKATLIK